MQEKNKLGIMQNVFRGEEVPLGEGALPLPWCVKPKPFYWVSCVIWVMKKNLKILVGLAGIFLVFAAMIVIPSLVESAAPEVCFEDGECLHEEFAGEVTSLIPLFIGIGAILGAVALYMFYERTAPASKADVALSLMGRDERAVVGRIVEEGGRVTQSEISKVKGLGKVKAHRILQKLERRGVLEKEQYGKTNMVKLSGKYRSLFFGED